MEAIGRFRQTFHVKGRTIKQIAYDLRLSRNTVRDVVRSDRTERYYERQRQPRPKLHGYSGELDRLLEANAAQPKRERLTILGSMDIHRAARTELARWVMAVKLESVLS